MFKARQHAPLSCSTPFWKALHAGFNNRRFNADFGGSEGSITEVAYQGSVFRSESRHVRRQESNIRFSRSAIHYGDPELSSRRVSVYDLLWFLSFFPFASDFPITGFAFAAQSIPAFVPTILKKSLPLSEQLRPTESPQGIRDLELYIYIYFFFSYL